MTTIILEAIGADVVGVPTAMCRQLHAGADGTFVDLNARGRISQGFYPKRLLTIIIVSAAPKKVRIGFRSRDGKTCESHRLTTSRVDQEDDRRAAEDGARRSNSKPKAAGNTDAV